MIWEEKEIIYVNIHIGRACNECHVRGGGEGGGKGKGGIYCMVQPGLLYCIMCVGSWLGLQLITLISESFGRRRGLGPPPPPRGKIWPAKPYRTEETHSCKVNRGRILGRHWDKSLKSFPPCYSQSPLLTNLPPPHPPPLSRSGLKLVCNVDILYGKLKSEYSQDYAQKPQRYCTFMISASGVNLFWRNCTRKENLTHRRQSKNLCGLKVMANEIRFKLYIRMCVCSRPPPFWVIFLGYRHLCRFLYMHFVK